MIGSKKMWRFTRIALLSIAGLVLHLCPIRAMAQGASVWGQALTSTGKPAAYATVRVCAYSGGGIPCTPLSSLYSDLALTQPVSNPYASDQYGNFSFFVASGAAYIVQLNVGSGITYSYLVTAGGVGGGTVSSVGLAAPSSILSVSGSPVTSSGTLTLALVNQSANTAFLGPPSGSAAAPTFRDLVAADITPAGTLTNNTSGNAATATALAGTPTNCSSGYAPTGIAASGNVQNCTQYALAGSSVQQIIPGAGILVSPSGGTGNVTVSEALPITGLTTIGTSGEASIAGGVLNIPQYCPGAGCVLLDPTGNQTITQPAGTTLSVNALQATLGATGGTAGSTENLNVNVPGGAVNQSLIGVSTNGTTFYSPSGNINFSAAGGASGSFNAGPDEIFGWSTFGTTIFQGITDDFPTLVVVPGAHDLESQLWLDAVCPDHAGTCISEGGATPLWAVASNLNGGGTYMTSAYVAGSAVCTAATGCNIAGQAYQQMWVDGDSINVGYFSTTPYATTVASDFRLGVPVNFAVAGSTYADTAAIEFAKTIPTTGNVLTLVDGGTNEQSIYGNGVTAAELQNYQGGIAQRAAELVIPDTRKTRGQQMTTSGTWTNYANYGGSVGICSTSVGATAQFNINSPSAFLSVLQQNGDTATASVNVTTPLYGYNQFIQNIQFEPLGGNIPSGTGLTYAPYLYVFDNLSAVPTSSQFIPHSIVITVASASSGNPVCLLWGADPYAATVQGSPTVFQESTWLQSSAGGVDPSHLGQFSQANQAVASMMAAHGLRVGYVNSAEYVNGTPSYYSDGGMGGNPYVHFSNTGAAQALIATEIAITNFQPSNQQLSSVTQLHALMDNGASVSTQSPTTYSAPSGVSPFLRTGEINWYDPTGNDRGTSILSAGGRSTAANRTSLVVADTSQPYSLGLYSGTSGPVLAVTPSGQTAWGGGGFIGSSNSVCLINGAQCPTIIVTGNITLTAAVSDSITMTGITASSKCSFSPTNATAAGLTSTTFAGYYVPSANTFTLNHAATTASGATYGVICSLN